MRTLILYVTHQDCANLDTFIKRGLIDSSDKEFIFIFNNPNPDFKKWEFLKFHKNVHLFIRPNIGHDFQGWNEALYLPISCLKKKIIYAAETESLSESFPKNGLNSLCKSCLGTTESDEEMERLIGVIPEATAEIIEDYLYKSFDKYIFVNSTVTGPYLPLYAEHDWADYFTSKLSDEVKLTGISVNFMEGKFNSYISQVNNQAYGFNSSEHAHIQSMVYATDKEGLSILMKYRLFHKGKQFPRDKWILIFAAEIGMSSILRHEKKSLYSYMMNQGLIKYDDVRNTGDLWCIKDCYPLCEMIFAKVNYCSNFGEKNRYDSCN